jgi:hypothetical protein
MFCFMVLCSNCPFTVISSFTKTITQKYGIITATSQEIDQQVAVEVLGVSCIVAGIKVVVAVGADEVGFVVVVDLYFIAGPVLDPVR